MNPSRLCVSLTLALLAGALSGLIACDPKEPQASDCTAFIDDEIADEWQVDFVNMRAEPVYVEVPCQSQPFTLTDAQGQYVMFHGSGCECYCNGLMDPGADACLDCASDCFGLSWVQRIDPGATWSVAVPGMVMVEAESPIPANCVDDPGEVGYSCYSRRAPEPGTYTARAASSSTLVCDEPDCDCLAADPEPGNCLILGSLGERVDVEATFEFPGTATIVFEP